MTKTIDAKTSYTAADSIPLKVLLHEDVRKAADAGYIPPIHIQIIPTNKCNLNCPFCSCSERDKDQEMPLPMLRSVVESFAMRGGTKAATITGGGEPLMYPYFSEMMDWFDGHGVKTGLVTNGLLLHKTSPRALEKLTWCRISNGDDRTFGDVYRRQLSAVVNSCHDVDWAFSHVVSSAPNFDEIQRVIEFAGEHHFTHVRLVSDLFHTEAVPMGYLREEMQRRGVDDSRVIYQGRKQPTRGGPCFIGYLKPLIAPDGKIYACCGVQYALERPSRDLPEELCIGTATDIGALLERSRVPLNGAICKACYYSNYNSVLAAMLREIDHADFV